MLFQKRLLSNCSGLKADNETRDNIEKLVRKMRQYRGRQKEVRLLWSLIVITDYIHIVRYSIDAIDSNKIIIGIRSNKYFSVISFTNNSSLIGTP